MTEIDVLEVTVPCGICGEHLHTHIPKDTVDDPSLEKPNVRVRCPKHGVVKRNLQRYPTRSRPWVYSNVDGVVLGVGETPQDAIANSLSKPHQQKASSFMPEANAKTAQAKDGDVRANRLEEAMAENSSQTPSTPNPEEPEQTRDSQSMTIQSIDDLPRWFRTQQRSIRWLRQLPKSTREITDVFEQRFVALIQFQRSDESFSVDLRGFDRNVELRELVHECIKRKDQTILLLRDQSTKTYLKPHVAFEETMHVHPFPP